MKKIQLSFAALSVIVGAVGALAFKTSPKANTTTSWFKYSTTANQTAASFNVPSNYIKESSEGVCTSKTNLCAIFVTVTATSGLLPVLPAGIGTAVAADITARTGNTDYGTTPVAFRF